MGASVIKRNDRRVVGTDRIGLFETYSDCGGTGATSIIVAAFPPDSSYGVLVVVQVVTDADLVALDEVLRSFDVVA